MGYCFARSCGTCWVCLAAAEQLRAIRARDRAGEVARLPADLQALYVELRGSGFAEDLAETVGAGDKMEVNHGSQNAKAVGACGTDAHALVRSQGQQESSRAEAELGRRLRPSV